jgi:DNA-binding XRE family transcriptional regulator
MSFGLKNKLADCLAEKNVRQSQLARHLDMSPAYVSRLVACQIQPCMIVALRIAHFFGKPVESIFQVVQNGQALKPRFQFPHGGLPSVSESISTAELKGK